MNVFSVNFDQSIASLQNKSIHLKKKEMTLNLVVYPSVNFSKYNF